MEVCLLQRRHREGACGQDHVRRERNQFRRVFAQPIGIAQAPPILDTHVSAVGPASFLQALYEGITAGNPFRIVRSQVAREHAYAPHTLPLLRARPERPRGRAAEQRDEVAPPHSITSSAVPRRLAGSSIPRVFAVLRLITSWNLVGACTGRPAIFSPLRIRSTYRAAPRNCSIRSGPYEIKPPSVTLKRSE